MKDDTITNIIEVSSTKRIAKNTLMLYFRQILIMLVSLYTVRVVLNVLGTEDYGIYNVVAGVVTMFSILSGAMASATQRFFSFELGTGDKEKLEKIFSVTLLIYVALALLIILLAETVGLWFVCNKLVIPRERFTAAIWIYQFSILSFAVTMITAPYLSTVIAHECMDIYAYVSIIEVVLKLVIVFLLKIIPMDKLVIYGLLMFTVTFLNTAIYRLICKKKFNECKFHLQWDGKMIKEITSYVGWNLFGNAVSVFNNQIMNIVLNQCFGLVVNAARAISSQVNSAVNSFAQNFSTATKPQIIKTYAANQKEECHLLVFQSCKITFFLMWVLTLPLVSEMQFVLKVWLKNVPDYAVFFAQLTLIEALINSVSYPIMTLAQATGKIKLYQGVVGGILLCNLPFACILLKLGCNPYSVMYSQIIVAIIATIARLVICNHLSRFSVLDFSIKVLIPLVLVVISSSVLPYFICKKLTISIVRFFINGFVCVIGVCSSMWLLGLNKNEKALLAEIIRKKIGRG